MKEQQVVNRAGEVFARRKSQFYQRRSAFYNTSEKKSKSTAKTLVLVIHHLCRTFCRFYIFLDAMERGSRRMVVDR